MPPKTKTDAAPAVPQDDTAPQADASTASPVAPSIEAEPDPIPEPIVAIEADGAHRPLSGGSFIRQPDGSITRNPEA